VRAATPAIGPFGISPERRTPTLFTVRLSITMFGGVIEVLPASSAACSAARSPLR